MVGKLFGLAIAALGAAASSLVERQTVTQAGNTVTISGVSSGSIIIIETNNGGGAGWNSVNPPAATTGKVHTVTVGGTNLVYNPESISAAVGDIVQFNFLAKNHSVVQSTFAQPCVNAQKFDSGFVPNPSGDTANPPAMRVQINTTDPTWFYCKQTGHCGKGMVFSVNPTADKTAAQFKAAAMASGGTVQAGSTPPQASSVATPAAAAPAVASQAAGTGTTGANGQCSCSCLCGSTTFGNPAVQGVAAFGGFGGMLSPAAAGAPKR